VKDNRKKMWTNIPKLGILSSEKKNIIFELESIWTIIDEIEISSINMKFIRFSDVSYNNNNSLWLYTICTIFKGEDKINIKNKSWTERDYCWLIEYDAIKKKNTVLFLWSWGWNWWTYFAPEFRYNYNNDIIFNSSYYYPRKYIWNLIDNDTANNFALDRNDINIYSSIWNFPNSTFLGDFYSLTGTYIWVYCWFGCSIYYTKNITYNIWKNYMSNQWISQDLYIPYYSLEKDFNKLIKSKGFKKFKWEISEELNKWDLDYIKSLNKNEFNINLFFEKVNSNLGGEDYNEENYYTWSWTVLKIKSIDPETVKFDFHENKNIEHPYLRLIEIRSNKYNGFFIYNIDNVTFLWLDMKWVFEWWISEKELLVSWKKVSLNGKIWEKYPIILWKK
jgi:hypothetical protein